MDSDDGETQPALRRNILRLHIGANSIALAASFVQVCLIPADSAPGYKRGHRALGWLTTALAIVGSCAGLHMGLDHGQHEAYGGYWGVAGWGSMFVLTMGPLFLGIRAAARRDIAAHKKWMNRFYGSMWGAFLCFRLLFLLNRVLLAFPAATTLLAVWGGAPMGIAIAEFAQRKWGVGVDRAARKRM